jgi:DNA-binding transcriptional MerR regulator
MAESEEPEAGAVNEPEFTLAAANSDSGTGSDADQRSDGGRPRLPGKSVAAFRTISEVSTDLEIPQHVLRFWETKFTQLRPLKRGGGRRYYRPEDIALLRRIHGLLYGEGYTIKGVQQVLRSSRKPENSAHSSTSAEAAPPVAEPTIPGLPKLSNTASSVLLRDLLTELKQLRRLLD